MKHSMTLASALAICVIVPAAAQQASDADARRAGESVLADWNRTAVAKDIPGHAALYTDDAIWVTPFGVVVGRAAIQKKLEDASKDWKFDPSKMEHVIMLGPDLMMRAGSWGGVVNTPTGPTSLHGYWSDIDVRDGNGWKIRQETWNLTPPPPPQQAQR